MVWEAWTKADFTSLTRDLPSMYFHTGSWILNTFAVRSPLVPLIDSPLAFWLTLNQHSIDILASGQLIFDQCIWVGQHSADYRPNIYRVSVKTSIEWWLSVDQRLICCLLFVYRDVDWHLLTMPLVRMIFHACRVKYLVLFMTANHMRDRMRNCVIVLLLLCMAAL